LTARQITDGAIVSGANPILGSRAAGARGLSRAAGRHVRARRLIGMFWQQRLGRRRGRTTLETRLRRP